ncbi:phasin family protein [Cupriavidus lacunae]|uniref:Phasin family protein n=1 Tax=Cupriavidus lacunae TaxID=2666307 RepID=A0A370MW53_9BURK|nr:phasin family protein [Cupriavidus lacunae]RDJ97630.1 phasin family protein [Cupriavidus lacunae]
MFLTSEQIAAAQRASLETLCGLTLKVFESLERLAVLNLQASKGHFADGANVTLKALSAASTQDILALQEEAIKPAHEKFLSYIRQLSEISDAAQLDFSAFIECVQAANAEKLQAFFAKVSEASPVASESTMAIVKSAIHAAQTAYVSVQKVAKETAELATSTLGNGEMESESSTPEDSKA